MNMQANKPAVKPIAVDAAKLKEALEMYGAGDPTLSWGKGQDEEARQELQKCDCYGSVSNLLGGVTPFELHRAMQSYFLWGAPLDAIAANFRANFQDYKKAIAAAMLPVDSGLLMEELDKIKISGFGYDLSEDRSAEIGRSCGLPRYVVKRVFELKREFGFEVNRAIEIARSKDYKRLSNEDPFGYFSQPASKKSNPAQVANGKNPPLILQSTLEEFTKAIEAEFIEGSAIAPDLFNAAVEIVSDTEIGAAGDCSDPIADFLNWDRKQAGFSRRESKFAALLRNEDGSAWQAKLNYQPWDNRKNQYKKPYQSPKSGGSRAYLPPIPRSIREKIAERYGAEVPIDGSFWDWVAESEIPVVITEGGKKALALLSLGYVAIALYGCDGGTIGKNGKYEPLPELQHFCTGGDREILIAFDQDEAEKTQRRVRSATRRLGKTLRDCGVDTVKIVKWSPADGKGADDFIVKNGAATWDLIVRNAFEIPGEGFAPTQAWLAAQATIRLKGHLAFDGALQDWQKYNPTTGTWNTVSSDLVLSGLKDLATGYLGDDYNSALIKGGAELLRIDREIFKPETDRARDMVTFRNTAVKLSTGEEIPFAPENNARWALARDYDPNQQDWEPIARFLSKALPSLQQDKAVCFHAALIRDLFAKIGDKRVLQQIGDSGTGKGTMTRLMTRLVGDHNSAPIDSIQWLQDKDFSLEAIAEQDPLLITIGDQTALQPRYSIGRLLQLTGRDKVQVNRKNKKHSSYTFHGAMVINAVEMPFSANHRKIGMERRSLLITGWRKDESLNKIEDQFTDEVLTGYTNFLLSLPEEYIVSTLTNASGNPTVQQEAARDPMVAWFMDCIKVTEDSTDRVQQGNDKEKTDQLFGSYFQYCRKSGTAESYIKNKGSFATDFEAFVRRAAKDNGWKIDIVKPSGKKLYTGLALKAEPDDSSSIDHSDTNEDSTALVTPVQIGIAEQLGTIPIDPTPTLDPTSKPAEQIDSAQDNPGKLVQFEHLPTPAIAASSELPTPEPIAASVSINKIHSARPAKGDWVTVQDDRGEVLKGQVVDTPSVTLHFWKVEIDNSRRILIPEREPHRIRYSREAIA